MLITVEWEEARETIVVVGCGPAWLRLVIALGAPLSGDTLAFLWSGMDNTPFETPSNKLHLLDRRQRSPFSNVYRCDGQNVSW